MIRISVTRAEGKEETYSFDKNSVMIGRASGNDIAIDLPGLSRYHARISLEGVDLTIEDVGSTNGTFVNGDRVQQKAVGEDDVISIGSVVFRAWFEPATEDVNVVVPPTPPVPKSPETSHGAPTADPTAQQPSLGVSPASPSAPVAVQKVATTGTRVPTPPPASASSPISSATSSPASVPASSGAQPAPKAAVQEGSSQDFYWQSLKSFLAPVWDYILDDAVSEIMINGPREIYFEKRGQLHRSDVQYHNDQLQAAVLNIAQYVGRRVSEEEPYLDARLPDGSRVAVLMPPCSRKGISISIRKFAKEKLTLDRLLEFGSLSKDMVNYLRAAVLLKKNIIVSGGTSSGKTSLLNVVSGLIPDDERILTIEDSAELQLRQDHVVPMETRPPDKKGRGQVTIRDLVRASLRMRPDRIVVGEIRGGEALDLLQAMNTGHSGSMATVHASSPRQALTRMETLALFSGLEIPMRALREQVSTALEVIIQASRLPDHSRKVVYISEVNPLTESGEYQVTDIFRFVRTGMEKGHVVGSHVWTGAKTGMFEEMELAGLTEMVEFFSQSKPESIGARH